MWSDGDEFRAHLNELLTRDWLATPRSMFESTTGWRNSMLRQLTVGRNIKEQVSTTVAQTGNKTSGIYYCLAKGEKIPDISYTTYRAQQVRSPKRHKTQCLTSKNVHNPNDEEVNVCYFADDLNWHPSACLLLCEMSPTSLGIVMDSKPNWKDIRTMLSLLEIFRTSVEQVFMDSPVVEMLLKEVHFVI